MHLDTDETLATANETIDRRIAAKEANLAELEARSIQLRNLAAEEKAFVRRLRSFVAEAEAERTRLQREFRRLVSTG